LVHVLVDALDDDALDRLADRLAPKLEARRTVAEPAPSGWLDAKGAAEYLGMTLHALHRLTCERRVPFTQDGPGCKLWFRPSELDAWRVDGA